MTAYEYRTYLKAPLPGPVDCIVTQKGQFTIRHFPRVEAAAIADTYIRREHNAAEQTLRVHRRELAERFNG